MSKISTNSRLWAVIPAAGIGQRMGSDIPKQYLCMAGKPILQHTLETLLAYPLIHKMIVVIAKNDAHWSELAHALPSDKIITVYGGDERSRSVYQGLLKLSNATTIYPKYYNDWVLVHDAVRPCLRLEDLHRLWVRLQEHPLGGALGIPVHDTLKRCDQHQIIAATLDRQNVWQAQTPQLFRFQPLFEALQFVCEKQMLATDEAHALELAGFHGAMMVEGNADNIKITRPEDLTLAEKILLNQKKERICPFE